MADRTLLSYLYGDPSYTGVPTTTQTSTSPTIGDRTLAYAPTGSTAPTGTSSGSTYVVKSGDSLSRIASQYGVPLSSISGYRSGDPNLIYPGETLTIGGAPSSTLTKQDGSLSRQIPPEVLAASSPTQSPTPTAGGTSGGLLPGASSSYSSSSSQTTTPQAPNYADNFNNVMMELLKSAQGVDTVELLKRKRALERATLGRAGEITPEELRTLSPGQQATIRGGKTKALSSEIDDNAYRLAKAEAQIDNFYKSFDAVSKMGAEFADKMPLPEKVRESFVEALQQRPTSEWGTILAGLNDKQLTDVLSAVDYSQIKDEASGGSRGGVGGGSGEGVDGGYSKTQLIKLRAAGIDPNDIKAADNYLYPPKEGYGTPVRMGSTQIQQLAEALYPLITGKSTTDKSGSVLTYKSIEELENMLKGTDTLDINGEDNGGLVIMDDIARGGLIDTIKALIAKDKTFAWPF